MIIWKIKKVFHHKVFHTRAIF